jgi:hypothetical protein
LVQKCALFPDTITAGLTFKAVLALSDYPANEWTLTAHLRGPVALNLTATADGTDHLFAVDATTTGGYSPGRYQLTLRASKDADVHEVQNSAVDILPDLAAVTDEYDGRTENEKALEAINAVIAKRATVDQERYRINNRELYRTPIEQLLKLRSFYMTQVRREKNKTKGGSTFGRRINVRFK